MNSRQIKHLVSIEQVLDTYGLLSQFRCVGHRLTGPCPIHSCADNRNAFVVDRNRNLWFCFTRCNRGGDVIDLVRAIERCSFNRALALLHKLAGKPGQASLRPHARPIIVHHGGNTTEKSPRFRPFTRKLALTKKHLMFRKMGLTEHTLHLFEAGYYPYHRGFLKHCLAVRLHDPGGNPIGYTGRRLDPRDIAQYGKWKIPWALPKTTILYNWHRARNNGKQPLIITEGPWAVMKLFQANYHNAVALLGLQLSETNRQLIMTSQAPHICLLLDGDKAGRRACQRIKNQLGTGTTKIILPHNVDPDDLSEQELNEIITSYVPK